MIQGLFRTRSPVHTAMLLEKDQLQISIKHTHFIQCDFPDLHWNGMKWARITEEIVGKYKNIFILLLSERWMVMCAKVTCPLPEMARTREKSNPESFIFFRRTSSACAQKQTADITVTIIRKQQTSQKDWVHQQHTAHRLLFTAVQSGEKRFVEQYFWWYLIVTVLYSYWELKAFKLSKKIKNAYFK